LVAGTLDGILLDGTTVWVVENFCRLRSLSGTLGRSTGALAGPILRGRAGHGAWPDSRPRPARHARRPAPPHPHGAGL